jgi:hypothetical protein
MTLASEKEPWYMEMVVKDLMTPRTLIREMFYSSVLQLAVLVHTQPKNFLFEVF